MKLACVTSHAGADCIEEAILSWGNCGSLPLPRFDFKDNDLVTIGSVYVADGRKGMLAGYERAWREAAKDGYDLLAHLHDDCLVQDPNWLPRVLAEFEGCGKCGYLPDQHLHGAYTANESACEKWQPNNVGLVGFCGALVHGSPELYKTRYDHKQLGRSYVLSNAVDAEVHGQRFTGSNDVATLDGLALIFRRELLEKAGGWPVGKIKFHCYDYWSTCIAHRFGYRVRVVGCAYHHLGGRTSVDRKMDDGDNHEPAHRWIAKEFSDVLPWSCI